MDWKMNRVPFDFLIINFAIKEKATERSRQRGRSLWLHSMQRQPQQSIANKCQREINCQHSSAFLFHANDESEDAISEDRAAPRYLPMPNIVWNGIDKMQFCACRCALASMQCKWAGGGGTSGTLRFDTNNNSDIPH